MKHVFDVSADCDGMLSETEAALLRSEGPRDGSDMRENYIWFFCISAF